ncbi:hypothetical protein HAX54_051033 [Datura stramonium]|uniref:Uncharacterized protein n=1 Tax=Datura stramonium TaxID=4076 RepID=A0ABS8RRT9_DATST|nr:hypothetical protein [Datura stramonium]
MAGSRLDTQNFSMFTSYLFVFFRSGLVILDYMAKRGFHRRESSGPTPPASGTVEGVMARWCWYLAMLVLLHLLMASRIGQKRTLDEGGDSHKRLHPLVPETSIRSYLSATSSSIVQQGWICQSSTTVGCSAKGGCPAAAIASLPCAAYSFCSVLNIVLFKFIIHVSMIGARGQTLAIVTRHKFVLITDRSISTLVTVKPISWVTRMGIASGFLVDKHLQHLLMQPH